MIVDPMVDLLVANGFDTGWVLSGGELVFWKDKVVELKAGEIMIFPSNFLYPHEVRMVTKGTRYSFVSWAW